MNRKKSLTPRHLGAFIATVIGIQSIFFSQLSHSALNGMAILNNFGKEKYIAALYVDTPTTSPESVSLPNNSAAMEFLIIDRSISKRSMARLWAESLAINADYSQLEKYADDFAALTSLIKGRLVTGDKLRIKNTETGVELTLNDIALGSVQSDGLFELLLQTWIGEVPPSTQFREQLLAGGNIDPTLKSRFDGLKPAEGRIQQITARWLAPVGATDPGASEADNSAESEAIASTPEVEANETEQTPEIVTASAAVVTEPVETEPTVPETATTTAVIETASFQGATSDRDLAPESEEQASLDSSQVADSSEPEAEVNEVEPEPQAEEIAREPPVQVALADTAIAQPVLDESAEEEEEDFSAEELLAGRRYYTDVKKRIYQRVEYPKQALKAGREGDVGLEVLLDATGKIIDTVVSQESQYRTFDREATRAVKRSGPFPAPPVSLLEDNQYQFRVVLRFKINPS